MKAQADALLQMVGRFRLGESAAGQAQRPVPSAVPAGRAITPIRFRTQQGAPDLPPPQAARVPGAVGNDGGEWKVS